MENKAIFFTAPNTAELLDKGQISQLPPKDVKVKTCFSTIS